MIGRYSGDGPAYAGEAPRHPEEPKTNGIVPLVRRYPDYGIGRP